MIFDRSQFTMKVSCPTCEQRGTIIWEEDNGLTPGQRNARRLVQISGFHPETSRAQSGDPLIVCDCCDQILED